MKDVKRFKAYEVLDLVQFCYEGTDEILFGYVTEDYTYEVDQADYGLVRIDKIIVNRSHLIPTSIYAKNIIRNFGKVLIKNFMRDNAEYFV